MTAPSPVGPERETVEADEISLARDMCHAQGGVWEFIQQPRRDTYIRHARAVLASPWFAAAVDEARREGADLHRDLVSRLGFGNNITEPMADNDTIVEWFEERRREADEWRESQRWRDECHLAGHPEDEDCLICDPLEVARREGAETALREAAREASRGPGWGPGLHGDPVPDLLAVSRWLNAIAARPVAEDPDWQTVHNQESR